MLLKNNLTEPVQACRPLSPWCVPSLGDVTAIEALLSRLPYLSEGEESLSPTVYSPGGGQTIVEVLALSHGEASGGEEKVSKNDAGLLPATRWLVKRCQ